MEERQRYYSASEGMTYKRKIDGVVVGSSLYLGKFIDGSVDVIENYEEVVDEEYQKRMEEHKNIMKELEKKRDEMMSEGVMRVRNFMYKYSR
jgi:ribosomal 50S subunit-associated protein YjgA (DUF615 family)